MNYSVYNHEWGSPDEARDIEADSAVEAAETFAEQEYYLDSEVIRAYERGVEIVVSLDNVSTRITVTAEVEYRFWGTGS